MARPQLLHGGLLVPNGSDVSLANARLAEVDRVDWNTLANGGYGVISGCAVTVAGTTATTLGGFAVVAGVLVKVAPGTVVLSAGGSLDRFDLLGVDSSGTFKAITGTPSNDAIFTDPPADFTLLATVLAIAGSSDFTDTLIDKRLFLPKTLLSQTNAASLLINNLDSNGVPLFRVSGDGTITWADVDIHSSGSGTLVVDGGLQVTGPLSLGGSMSVTAIASTGDVLGANIYRGAAAPGGLEIGGIFQSSVTGKHYIKTLSGLEELLTTSTALPVGTVIDSLQPPTIMVALGWMPFDGRVISEDTYPTLFTVAALLPYVTGVAPHRSMTMPNLTDRVRMTNFSTVGQSRKSTTNTITITIAQLPQHKHNTTIQLAGGGTVSGTISRNGIHTHAASGGAHPHDVDDPGHQHPAADFFGQPVGVISVLWGGQNKIDGLFNDRNHTYSVDALFWTGKAITGITVGSGGSDHGHILSDEGDHDHGFTGNQIPQHVHPVSENDVGSGQSIDITPANFTTFTYVKF